MNVRPEKLIVEMADKIPGLVASAIVHLEDGLSIAEVTRKDGVDPGAASVYLANIVKSNRKAIHSLVGDQVTDDILITTDEYRFLIKQTADRPYFLFVITEKDEWLGRARLIMQAYIVQMEEVLG